MPISLSVELSRADKAKSPYFYVPFEVPQGTTRIDVAMRYAKADDCVIDLGLFDTGLAPFPAETGFRGWSGGARDHFFVATDAATPGYLPGALPAGRWCVILGLYRLPDAPVRVMIELGFDDGPRDIVQAPEVRQVVRPGAGWYRGDLHSHCFHSDAAGSPELLHASARQAGLDFLAVADHNTISQRRYFNAASSADLVFIRALEVTTEFGHANVFGLDDWIDFRFEAQDDALRMADLVRRKGGLLSINHDKPPIEWGWTRPVADCMEVWQSAWPALNEVSLARYQALLASGQRLSAVGGSDYHQPDHLEPEHPLGLGRPTTVLLLDDLSERSVLEALRLGRGYITESPQGPHLAISVGGVAMGGEAERTAKLEIEIDGAAGDLVQLIDRSGVFLTLDIEAGRQRLSASIESAQGFVRAEIIARASREAILGEISGHLPDWPSDIDAAGIENAPLRRAISNPIYLS